MTQISPLRGAQLNRVALAIDDAAVSDRLGAILALRGLSTTRVSLSSVADLPTAVAAHVPSQAITIDRAIALAPLCRAAAGSGRPVVIMSATASEPPVHQQIIALALLRNSGALICDDPDTFIELTTLCAAFGLPRGSNTAVVAPAGSLLAAQVFSEERRAQRSSRLRNGIGDIDAATDVVLVDLDEFDGTRTVTVGGAMVVPLVARAESLAGTPALSGYAAAQRALALGAELGQRLREGLGPAPAELADELQPDRDRFARQLRKLGGRAGDHETKVLLAAYGIGITRQAVATTPSAASRIAKQAGFPVEIKPWGPDQPGEHQGCPVIAGLNSSAEVRRAFAAASAQAGLDLGSPVIVRETPPRGRELSVHLHTVTGIGPVMLISASHHPEPLASPAPLRRADAEMLACLAEATRADDRRESRDNLIDALIRLSHLYAENADVLSELSVGRLVVSTEDERVIAADASAVLVSDQ